MLLLLADDLELQELLLLLKKSGVRRVHGGFTVFLLLVWWDVLVVFQLPNPRSGFSTSLVPLVVGLFGLALLHEKKGEKSVT